MAKNDALAYRKIDHYLTTQSRETDSQGFFAVLCTYGSTFHCVYFNEYACYLSPSSQFLGIVDCVAGRYYVSKEMHSADIESAKANPFRMFSKETGLQK